MEDLHATLTTGFINKDTAFSLEERERFGLLGRLPPRVETMDEQIDRCEAQFSRLNSPMERWLYLNNLQTHNSRLFFALVAKNLETMLPVVYTPTVGDACTHYSEIWDSNPRGLYLNRGHLGRVQDIVDAWEFDDVEIIVCTDGSRILGLGDLGFGGHQIAVGKLALYSLGGFDPAHTLPVSFDFGVSKENIRLNPHYLGVREPADRTDDYLALIDEFVHAVKRRWPHAVLQFEDFSNDHAFSLLDNYKRVGSPVFNDDISGTACVTAAVVSAAIRGTNLRLEAAGSSRRVCARDQVYVMLGAGAGGIGVARQVAHLSVLEGASEEDAYAQFYVIDSRGLITSDRPDAASGSMPAHKVPFARKDVSHSEQLLTLIDVVRRVKPTCLLGLSTIHGAFNEAVLTALAAGCPTDRQDPFVLALSNPTSKAECTPDECMRFTFGRAFFASGSPFEPVDVPQYGAVSTSQSNNLYCFPAIGLGAAIAKASEITDEQIAAVSLSLASTSPDEDVIRGQLLPRLTNLREITANAAVASVRQAQRDGVARAVGLPEDDAELKAFIQARMWQPRY
jgi:malic enzyme